MKKVALLSAITVAVSFGMTAAHANMDKTQMMEKKMAMKGEKCTVMKDGKNIVKANKNDCKTASHSCAGQAKAGEADSWIYVPKGQCQKINAGDFSGAPKEVKDKVEGA